MEEVSETIPTVIEDVSPGEGSSNTEIISINSISTLPALNSDKIPSLTCIIHLPSSPINDDGGGEVVNAAVEMSQESESNDCKTVNKNVTGSEVTPESSYLVEAEMESQSQSGTELKLVSVEEESLAVVVKEEVEHHCSDKDPLEVEDIKVFPELIDSKGDAGSAVKAEPELVVLKTVRRTYGKKSATATPVQPWPAPNVSIVVSEPKPVTLSTLNSKSRPESSKEPTSKSNPGPMSSGRSAGIRGKRKSFLIVDAHKQIKNADFKRQLVETEDILHKPNSDIAPCTKQAVKWLESGAVPQFFTCPGRAIKPTPLAKLYCDRLVVNVEEDGMEKGASIAPLDWASLSILSEAEKSPEKHGKTKNSSKSNIKQLKIGTMSSGALDSVFKTVSKPTVLKDYTSVRWTSPTQGVKGLDKSYSKRKLQTSTRNEIDSKPDTSPLPEINTSQMKEEPSVTDPNNLDEDTPEIKVEFDPGLLSEVKVELRVESEEKADCDKNAEQLGTGT